jgi:pimeloyl-ACP methyl ester carboxylesterase
MRLLQCRMKKKVVHLQPADVQAFAQLAVQATKGIADLVEAMHASIASPFGMASKTEATRTRGVTGFVYKAVRATTSAVGAGLDAALAQLTPELINHASSFERNAIRSAINGVLGDYLHATQNSLAIPMAICHDGEALTLDREALAALKPMNGKVLLFIHGLCMNDRQWANASDVAVDDNSDQGAALAKSLGYTPLYLRYNSGLHTSDNGQQLADLLAQLCEHWPHLIDTLSIVAHSMGGLVSRSAAHHAAVQKMQWLKHLKHIVFLGTPHQGAPLERAGHWVDVILSAAPYAKPFARLGKIRSVGITDLRYGNVCEADWANADSGDDAATAVRTRTPLPKKVASYAIAATLGKDETDWKDKLLGDGLVPVTSALGISSNSKQSLSFPAKRHWIAYQTSHMQLLNDKRVFDRIHAWLAEGDKQTIARKRNVT